MDIEKFTERARGFLQAAQTIAIREENQRVVPEHLLKALMDDEQGLAANLIRRAGGAPERVVEALEAALWAFHTSDNFEDGALKAVNLGEDADTTGAIYGQLAGAYYGVAAIPAPWRTRLTHAEAIARLADGLLDLAGLEATD